MTRVTPKKRAASRVRSQIAVVLAGAALLLAGHALAPEDSCAAGTCGFKPLKPIPPIGCRDLEAVCQCDAQGRNCRWVWQCV